MQFMSAPIILSGCSGLAKRTLPAALTRGTEFPVLSIDISVVQGHHQINLSLLPQRVQTFVNGLVL